MPTVLDSSAVRRWCSSAGQALEAQRDEIDDLNVFPIPDGDTGTNLALTLRSAGEAVDADGSPTPAAVLAAMARGAVMGARGNSGAILSQILSGLAEGCCADGAESAEIDGRTLARAFDRARAAAYAAVEAPVEGTILSVLAAAAEACAALAGSDPEIGAVVTAARDAAESALARTTEQLDVLARAGVVDAGGKGLVVLLEALAEVITGELRNTPGRPVPAGRGRAGRSARALETEREAGSPEYGYEVQYLLHATDRAADRLKATLAGLGDSLVVVGAGTAPDGGTGPQGGQSSAAGTGATRLFNVHVHVNDVGAAIEAGIEAGTPHRITVVRFAEQLAESAAVPERAGVAIVAVAPGVGLAEIFRAEGVLVVDGGPTQNPSTADVLAGITDTGAARVILLPNASAVTGVARLAADEARAQGIEVAVIPTKSPVQGLAAVAVHDEARRFADDVIAMAEAAAATHFAEVTVAVRESITYAGRCEAGDVLGLIDGEVVEIGSDPGEVGVSLVRRLIAAGGELVTVLSGSDPGAGEAATAVEAYLRSEHPLVEVSGYPGGQPHYPLLIGVE